MSLARDIHDLLAARASSGRNAYQISEATFAKVIAVLRQRFGLSYQEAELLLIDIARDHEDILRATLRDRITVDDAQDAVCRCLGEDQ
jgi:hypothetical protein